MSRPAPPDRRPSLALLNQDTWWVTRDNRRLRVEHMTPRHRRNLLRYLRNRTWFVPKELGTKPCTPEWMEAKPLVKKLTSLVADDELNATRGFWDRTYGRR